MKYIKLFNKHNNYVNYITSQDKIIPNLSYCIDEEDTHLYVYPSVKLTLILSEPSNERIAVKGNLSIAGGSETADGLSNVKILKIDGKTIDIENDITLNNIVDYYGTIIEGYFYNFETSGEHTIEYILNEPIITDGMCATIGDNILEITETINFQFPSKITSLTSKLISIQEIGNASFTLSTIKNIDIPNTVTTIGNCAFMNCNHLTSVIIPDSVTSIGNSVFYECSDLTKVILSNNITNINDGAFVHCINLTSIGEIGSGTSIELHNNITTIGVDAFNNCDGLLNITIPDNITTIDERAFYGCDNLTSITVLSIIPPTLGYDAFIYKNNLNIYVPAESVEAYKSAWSNYANYIQAISY